MSVRGDAGSFDGLKKIVLATVVGVVLIILYAIDVSIVTGAGVGNYILQALNKVGFMIPSSVFLILTVATLLICIVVTVRDLLKTF